MPKTRMRAHVSSYAPLRGPHALRHAGFIVVALILGLIIDRLLGVAGQIATSIVIWALMLYLLAQQTPAWRLTLIIGCAFACGVEMLLSLVIGWYDYQFFNIPPFVPPGHILLFMLAVPLSQRMPQPVFRIVPWVVAGYGIYAGVSGTSTFDAVLAVIFLLIWQRKHSRPIYITILFISLALELWGTWLGNWTWRFEVPYSGGLVTGNPPLLAGALYGVFDILLMKLARKIHQKQGDVPPPLEEQSALRPALA